MDVEGTNRQFEQKHMVNWIVDSVVKGITPDQVDNPFNKTFWKPTGPFKCYVKQWGVGGIWISADQHYERACSNVTR